MAPLPYVGIELLSLWQEVTVLYGIQLFVPHVMSCTIYYVLHRFNKCCYWQAAITDERSWRIISKYAEIRSRSEAITRLELCTWLNEAKTSEVPRTAAYIYRQVALLFDRTLQTFDSRGNLKTFVFSIIDTKIFGRLSAVSVSEKKSSACVTITSSVCDSERGVQTLRPGSSNTLYRLT